MVCTWPLGGYSLAESLGGLQQGCNDWELSRAMKKSVEKDSVMELGSWKGQLRSSLSTGEKSGRFFWCSRL
jgi:hypothetical protein